MKTERKVNRTQRAEYVSGALKAGYVEYTVTGYEYRGASSQTVSLSGRAEFTPNNRAEMQAAREAAAKAAWATARAWISELGELVRTDRELRSEAQS